MITVRKVKPGWKDENGMQVNFYVWDGNKDDVKPTGTYEGFGIENGSLYRDIDSGNYFLYDREKGKYGDPISPGGGGGGVDPSDIATDEEIAEVISNLDDL